MDYIHFSKKHTNGRFISIDSISYFYITRQEQSSFQQLIIQLFIIKRGFILAYKKK